MLEQPAGLLTFGSLPDRAFPSRYPPTADASQWHLAIELPDYSGGTVADLHRVPKCRCSLKCAYLVQHTVRAVNR